MGSHNKWRMLKWDDVSRFKKSSVLISILFMHRWWNGYHLCLRNRSSWFESKSMYHFYPTQAIVVNALDWKSGQFGSIPKGGAILFVSFNLNKHRFIIFKMGMWLGWNWKTPLVESQWALKVRILPYPPFKKAKTFTWQI